MLLLGLLSYLEGIAHCSRQCAPPDVPARSATITKIHVGYEDLPVHVERSYSIMRGRLYAGAKGKPAPSRNSTAKECHE